MADESSAAALRKLLDQLRDHVARFGGVSWLRERGVDTGPLEAVADGETAGEHYERIREAVRADVAARADEALGGLTPSSCGPSPALLGPLVWPTFDNGTPIAYGDAVQLRFWLPDGPRSTELLVVRGFALEPGDSCIVDDDGNSYESCHGVEFHRPSVSDLARGIADTLDNAMPSEMADASNTAAVFARGILARLAEGGDRDAR